MTRGITRESLHAFISSLEVVSYIFQSQTCIRARAWQGQALFLLYPYICGKIFSVPTFNQIRTFQSWSFMWKFKFQHYSSVVTWQLICNTPTSVSMCECQFTISRLLSIYIFIAGILLFSGDSSVPYANYLLPKISRGFVERRYKIIWHKL